MSRPLRILLVNKAYPPHIGGIETLVRQYARCFQTQFSAEVQVLVCQERAKQHGKPSRVFRCCEPEVLGHIFPVRFPVRFFAIFGSMPSKRMW